MKNCSFSWVVVLSFCLLPGCAWLGEERPPEWILSPQARYPIDQYLTGIGQAETREQAERRAYAAVSRVFTAQVKAQSMDREWYSIQESGEMSRIQRELYLDHRTQVTTTKVLENVHVLEVWYQPSSKQFFALAGLDRQQAEQAILERLEDRDATIDTLVNQGRTHPQKIQRVRGYKQAMTLLADRHALNADLRVIRPSGASQPSPYHIPLLQREFLDFVANEFVIVVKMNGKQALDLERAILEVLKQEGLSAGGQDSVLAEGPGTEDILIEGQGKLWTVDLPDPIFRYVRWCADIDIYEQPSQRLIGVISETGREGHITEREARVRANSAMQHTVGQEVVRLLTQSLFQETSSSTSAQRAPKSCPH